MLDCAKRRRRRAGAWGDWAKGVVSRNERAERERERVCKTGLRAGTGAEEREEAVMWWQWLLRRRGIGERGER